MERQTNNRGQNFSFLRFVLSRNNFFYFLLMISVAVCFIATCFLLYYSFYGQPASQRIYYSGLVVIFGIFVIVPLTYLYVYSRSYARILRVINRDFWVHWKYPKESRKGDVYFCDEGVYDTKNPFTLNTFGQKFLRVYITPEEPKAICFTRVEVNPYSDYYFNKGDITHQITQEVPIPPGKEEEAEQLVQRFQVFINKKSKLAEDLTRYSFWMIGVIFGWIILTVFIVVVPASNQFQIEKIQLDKEKTEARERQTLNQITPLWNKIRQTIEPKIEQLKTLPNGKFTPQEAGFDENSEVLTVLYGRCLSNNEFYVSVVLKKVAIKQSTYAPEKVTGAFNYTTTRPFPPKRSDSFCRAIAQKDFGWRIELTDGWIYGEIDNQPYLQKPTPSANSTVNKTNN